MSISLPISSKMPIRWALPLLILYIGGGFLQYLGIISVTQSNVLVLALFSPVLLFRSSWRQARLESPLIIFMAFVVAIQVLRNPPLQNTFTYLYYILCTAIAALAGRVYATKWISELNLDKFFRVATWFLALQLCVTLVQASITETYIDLSRASIGFEDAIFGTFFLQSDAALAAACEFLLIAAFFLPCRTKTRVTLTALAIAVVFLGNSKAAQACILLLVAILATHAFSRLTRLNRSGLTLLLAIVGILAVFLTYSMWSEQLSAFIQQSQDDYSRREEWITASRFAPIGQIFSQGLDMFGQGPLTYYNPLTKAWLYNAGFSTLYALYIDFGLTGFLLYFSYQLYLIFRFTDGWADRACFLIVFSSFTAFNLALTDISFVFALNFTLMMIYKVRLQHRDSSQ